MLVSRLTIFYLLLVFFFNQELPQRITFLNSVLFLMSIFLHIFRHYSRNLLFGFPLFLFSGISVYITLLPTYSWSLLMTCPYHLSLTSLIFISNRSTLTVRLMYSFLILSFLVTPIANLNIFISAIFISFTCFFVTVTVSNPYTIAGLTTELYTFPFTLAGNLQSQITPDIFLHPFHPAFTLLFTSLSQLPLSWTVDPNYLNSFTLGTFVFSIFTVSSSFPPFMHRYLVFDLLTYFHSCSFQGISPSF